MSHDHGTPGSNKSPLMGIGIVIAVYIALLALGWPQYGTQIATADHGHGAHEASEGHGEAHDDHAAAHDGHGRPAIVHPPYPMVVPFALLLGAIAVLPLLPLTEHWWESNLHRFYVAAALGAVTLIYFLFAHPHTVVAHWPGHGYVEPSSGAVNVAGTLAVLANAILAEYVPFIILLFSLYTISGGIRIEGDLRAHPLTNAGFIAIGGLLASFIGTTGAAMLLIRPLLETNSERKHVVHTVVFFIFVVCNCGGCLLPIGDPPLFMGYLFGVPFLWTFSLWPAWLFVNCVLLVIYVAWDHFVAYPKEAPRDVALDETRVRGLKISGLWPNLPLLAGVVLCVGLLDPTKALPGTEYHPPLFLREILQVALVGLSLLLGSDLVRRRNNFNYHAILEVAALFFGIFICMQPAIQILNVRGPALGLEQPWQFFWATGGLSAVLDNAPTYVVFFETASSLSHEPGEGIMSLTGGKFIREDLLVAISLGAVFLGAMTYIGNGPNFMVKAIAEKSGVKMPSFFGYMVYSCAILLPTFLLVNYVLRLLGVIS